MTGLHVKLQFGNTYRIMTLMKVETIIIGSFVASPIIPNVMLVIMNVEAFKTIEFMLFFLVTSQCEISTINIYKT